MDAAASWKTVFESWPAEIPRQGSILTLFGDTIPFCNFMVAGALVLLDRDKPDQYGTRKVILSWSQIACLRMSTTLELSAFSRMGFTVVK